MALNIYTYFRAMSNKTPETMIYQQGYCQRNKEKCLEKTGQYDEENKERLQKMGFN